MRNFLRTLKYSWRYRYRLAASVVCALLVAALWSLNLSAIYPVLKILGTDNNLHEWVDDPNGTFRGGYYMDTERNGDGCKYATTAHDFGYHDYSTGFRCCMDPERVE